MTEKNQEVKMQSLQVQQICEKRQYSVMSQQQLYQYVCYAAWHRLLLNCAADDGDGGGGDVSPSVDVPVGAVPRTLKAGGFHLVFHRLYQVPDDRAECARPDDLGRYVPAVAVLHLLLSTENRDCLMQHDLNDRPSHHGHLQPKKKQSAIYRIDAIDYKIRTVTYHY